jgi:hypothetical protein
VRSGLLHVSHAYEAVRANEHEIAERNSAIVSLRATVSDLADLFTIGELWLPDAVASAEQRAERAHRSRVIPSAVRVFPRF